MSHRSTGPPGSPTATWATSGVVALTGHPDAPPLVPPGHAASTADDLARDICAATGGRVDLDGSALLAERAAFTGHTRRGRISAGGHARLLPTADGWAAASCARPDDPLLYGALVEAPLPADDPWPAISAWLATHTGNELAERAGLLGLAAAPIEPPAAPLRQPARPIPRPDGSPTPTVCPDRPVDGLLVVDFSALWAGPLCAHLLGLAGARVVKVETPGRPDGARRGNPDFYRLLHGGHRSVVLDPATPPGRRALGALVRAADIVIEASRPRALRGFGLDADAEVARGASWVSITAAGRADNRIGFGDDIAAAAGLVATDHEGSPVFCGDALADPLTGLTAAACALTAPADGSGTLWDLSMTDIVAATLDATPTRPCRRRGAGWVAETTGGPVPVAAPRRREAALPAPAGGADTPTVLARLGIPAP